MSEAAQEIKDRQRQVWALGNYSEVANFLAPASVALADACGIGPGTKVLDVGAGTGNLALEAARRGATVVASDLTPELIEIGRERTTQEGLAIEWAIADAEDLQFEEDRFDVVTSVFGAMFAPRASKVAEEMLRVTRPGGLVGFTSWAGDGFTGQTFKLSVEYGPPTPAGLDNAGSWGDEEFARARFEEHGAEVE
ncbi:MAG: class I SAM-dependent methyltransferase, partial [Actinomycetota bacterium]|nr:class I SAM-dependent methyltransferase [Actinomycetota bacterium]